MGSRQLVGQVQEVVASEKGPKTERELLIEIVRLQTMLNSKMFEFIRGYQQQHNWGGENSLFTDGSGRKTRTARLLEEVNEIGFALNQSVTAFIGEGIFEKRDGAGRVLAHCDQCKKETPFVTMVDAPYGLSGAYMEGSERLVCTVCKNDVIYPDDPRMPKFNTVWKTK